MQLSALLSTITILGSVGGLVQASPIRCPDSTRDAILKGELSPEACCSYGVCLNEVVAAMADWAKDESSALKWNSGRWGYR
ncbi:hypothetical protein MGN70_005917 [Eutypa lata]|nr:hypothetical protein MGN70_005917 [Eutypa lata]